MPDAVGLDDDIVKIFCFHPYPNTLLSYKYVHLVGELTGPRAPPLRLSPMHILLYPRV